MYQVKKFIPMLMGSVLSLASLSGFAKNIPNVQTYSSLPDRGVNLSGGAFRDDGSGLASQGAFLPVLNDAALFIYRGMNTFRIPIAWEYLANIDGAFKTSAAGEEYLANLTQVVNDLTSKGATVIIDLHNYMRYNPTDVSLDYKNTDPQGTDVIGYGSEAPTTEAYANLWKNIVDRFHDVNIVYDIMNEPHDMSNSLMLVNQNAAISAIRSEEAVLNISQPHLILIEGNNWSGLHSWSTQTSLYPSQIHDPMNNVAYEAHQYLDADYSGTYVTGNCIAPNQFEKSFDAYWATFTKWSQANQTKVFLGEFGAPDTSYCRTDLKYLLDHINKFAVTPDQNYGVLGWTAWAAGHAWGNYILSLAPGSPDNVLMWNNALYQNYLTEVENLPKLGAKASILQNNTNTKLVFASGYWPFQLQGDATLQPGASVYLYSPNDTAMPGRQIELDYHTSGDAAHVIGIGIDENGWGYKFGTINGMSINSVANCPIKPSNGDTHRCWEVDSK